MTDARACVWPLVEETQRAVHHELYMVALMGALSWPSIVSALGSENGKSTGSTYRSWMVQFHGSSEEDAAEIYGLRCSLLHEGSAHPHRTQVRTAFVWPGAPGVLDNLTTDMDGDVVRWVDIPSFVRGLAASVDRWIDQYGETRTVRRNLERYARFRPEGLPPHVVGLPVIA